MRELNHKAVNRRGHGDSKTFVTVGIMVKLEARPADYLEVTAPKPSDLSHALEFEMKGYALVLASLLVTGIPAQADVLLLDSIQSAPPNTASGVLRPRGGETMDSVRAGFGDPANIQDAVGEPPITRWIYPDYTVYFEFDRVIEVVVHR
jgi:hypothetical protein